MTPLEMVTEFHKTYGAPIAEKPVRRPENFDLRLSLLLEEAQEYVEAKAKDDFIEQIDALADIVYVAYGALLTHGATKGSSFSWHSTESNFTNEIIKYGNLVSQNNNHYTHLSQHTKTFDAVPFIEDIVDALFRIIGAAYSIARDLDVNLDAVLTEVHRSNMSKLHHETGLPIYREDGKVLKGENYFKPDIARVIADTRFQKFYSKQPSEVQYYLSNPV